MLANGDISLLRVHKAASYPAILWKFATDSPRSRHGEGSATAESGSHHRSAAKGGRGLEIGTQRGNFAKHMLQVAEPEQLHLVDITYDLFDKPWFDNYISSSQVILHEGVSWSIVNDFEKDSFDWIYIDAGHDYESVTKDIVASWDKVKPGGYLIFNDFTSWSPLEMIPYGVMQAVCEFQLGHAEDFSIAWFAFHPQGYHDIALRREK